MKVLKTNSFQKEFNQFPENIRENIISIIDKYLDGERLPATEFKTFKIDKDIKIQEFKAKDHTGNWRAISCIVRKDYLILFYAFHKKSQTLLEKNKDTIRKRIKRIEL